MPQQQVCTHLIDYIRRCNEKGISPNLPGARAQQDQQRPAAAAVAAALLEDPAVAAAAAEIAAAACMQEDEVEVCSLDDFQFAGACMLSDGIIAAAAEPARTTRSSQQPLSFVPPTSV
jgi:hypothetical protein